MSVAISWANKMQLAKCDIMVGFPISSHILYYMKVKYITSTNKHLFDVSLPLDDEMKLKAWHYQH